MQQNHITQILQAVIPSFKSALHTSHYLPLSTEYHELTDLMGGRSFCSVELNDLHCVGESAPEPAKDEVRYLSAGI